MLRTLTGLSFLSGAVLWLCPEGGVRRILTLLCTAILAAAALSPLRELDRDSLTLAEARFASAEAEITHRADETRSRLEEQLMRENCECYIAEKARALGLTVRRVRAELRQDGSGAWVPWSAEIEADGPETEAERLCRTLRDELGIPTERQVWVLNE